MSNSSLTLKAKPGLRFSEIVMKEFGITTNKKRKEFISRLQSRIPETILKQTMEKFHPDTRKVLQLHYMEGRSLKELIPLLGKSISIIRNHRNRGIFKLYQEFGADL